MGIGRPAWLEALYKQRFFVGCPIHESAKKNERNICCLDCCSSICPHCLPSHRRHRLLQIRRYVYHNVVRLEDLDNLIDSSNVQPYTINGAKVVFIKKRPQNRQFKGSGNFCTSCDRCLQEPYIHCSLACKVDFVLKYRRDLSPYLRTCNSLQLGPDFIVPPGTTGDEFDDSTRSTIVDCDEQMSSSGSDDTTSGAASQTRPSRIVRKKRSGLHGCAARSPAQVSYAAAAASTSMSRRKGVPQRSPLC